MTPAVKRPPAVQLDWVPVWSGDTLLGYRARLVGAEEWDGVRYVDRGGAGDGSLFVWSSVPWDTGTVEERSWVCFVQLVGPGRWLLTTQGWHPSGRRHRSFGSCTAPATTLQAAFDVAGRWARRRFRAEWCPGWPA